MEADCWARSGLAGRPLVVASRSCHSLWLEQWEGPSRENSKDNERSARQAGGRSSGQVLVRPTAQWTGRGTRRKGGTLSKYEKLPRSALLKARTTTGLKPRTYGSQVGARPRSILDQTIGEKIVQFPTETTETLNGSSARWAYLFRAPLSWREQNNRERPGRSAQGSRASFIVERMGSESKGFRFRFWFGGFRAPLDLIRSWEGGRSLNQWTLMNHHWWTLHMTRSIRLKAWRHSRT